MVETYNQKNALKRMSFRESTKPLPFLLVGAAILFLKIAKLIAGANVKTDQPPCPSPLFVEVALQELLTNLAS